MMYLILLAYYRTEKKNDELGEELPEDFEGLDVEGAFTVIADVLQKYVGYSVSLLAGEGEEEGLREGALEEGFYLGEGVPGKGEERLQRRRESQRLGVLQQEAQVEVGEVPFQGVQGQDAAAAPVKEAFLVEAVADAAVEHFGQEHRNGVLVHIAPEAVEGVKGRYVFGAGKLGLGVLYDIGFKDAQGQEHSH